MVETVVEETEETDGYDYDGLHEDRHQTLPLGNSISSSISISNSSSSSSSSSRKRRSKRAFRGSFPKERILDHYAIEARYGCRPAFTPRCAAFTVFCAFILSLVFGIVCPLSSLSQVECLYEYDSLPIGDYEVKTHTVTADHCSNVAKEPGTTISPPIYIYFQLEGFNQNDSQYMNSKLDEQLRGRVVTDRKKVLSHCGKRNSFVNNDQVNGKILHPCGAFPRSFFNDSLLYVSKNEISTPLPIDTSAGALVWDVDLKMFKNPTPADVAANQDVVDFWLYSSSGPFGSPVDANPTGVENPHFIAWMRPSALPDLRKIIGILRQELPVPFSFSLLNRYNLKQFGGRKKIVFMRPTFAGGRTLFIGIAYCIVSAIMFLLFVFAWIQNAKRSRRTLHAASG